MFAVVVETEVDVVAVAVAQGNGKIVFAVVEDDSVPFVHRSRTRKEFCYHANRSDHRRRNARVTI